MDKIIFFILICLVVFNTANSSSSVNNAEGVLIKRLLTVYDKDVKPTLDPNEVINVTIQFFVTRIENLNEKTQVLSSFGFFILTWTDAFLQWDPYSEGTGRFIVSANRVWLPEIAPENRRNAMKNPTICDHIDYQHHRYHNCSLTTIREEHVKVQQCPWPGGLIKISEDERETAMQWSPCVESGFDLSQDTKFRVQVAYDGTVFWAPAMKWQTYCEVDLKHFPYDVQTCDISFVNWIYGSAGIRFVSEQTEVDRTLYLENGEWELDGSEVFSFTRNLPGSSETFPATGFTIKLRRKPTYFVLNVIIPSIILSCASLLVFCLPVESGEKVSLSITIMLSYSVLLLVVSDVTPRSGSGQPYLSYYMVASMGITAVSLIATVVVLSIFYHDPSKPLPSWLRALTIHGLAYITCFSPNYRRIDGVVEVKEKENEKQAKSVEKTNGQVVSETNSPIPLVVAEYFTRLAKKEAEANISEKNKEDWGKAAKIIDRFCFLVSLFVIVALILFLVIGMHGD